MRDMHEKERVSGGGSSRTRLAGPSSPPPAGALQQRGHASATSSVHKATGVNTSIYKVS